METDLVEDPAEMIPVAAVVLAATEGEPALAGDARATDLRLPRAIPVDMETQRVPVVAHREVVPGLDLEGRRPVDGEGISPPSAEVEPGLGATAEEDDAVVSLGLFVGVFADDPGKGFLRGLVIDRDVDPEFEGELRGLEFFTMRNLEVVRPIASEASSDPAKRPFRHWNGENVRTRRENEGEPVGPRHRLEPGFGSEGTARFVGKVQSGDIDALEEAPRINQARPFELAPRSGTAREVALSLHRDRELEFSGGQRLPGGVVSGREPAVAGSLRDGPEVRDLQRLRVHRDRITSRLDDPPPRRAGHRSGKTLGPPEMGVSVRMWHRLPQRERTRLDPEAGESDNHGEEARGLRHGGERVQKGMSSP